VVSSKGIGKSTSRWSWERIYGSAIGHVGIQILTNFGGGKAKGGERVPSPGVEYGSREKEFFQRITH